MCGTVLSLAMVALGVDVGWQPLPDGGMEYIIQIEPHMLEMLKSGADIVSDIPPNLRGVRSYRITVGTDELPREGELKPEPEVPPAPEVQSPYREAAQPVEPETTPESPPVASDESPSGLLSSDVPRTLTPPADTRALADLGEKAAAFVNQQSAEPNPPATPEDVAASDDTAPEKPWLPLTLAMAALFGSLGGMLYVGWIAWGYRRRYQALLARVIDAGERRVAVDETMINDDSVYDPG